MIPFLLGLLVGIGATLGAVWIVLDTAADDEP
jgi:hypothetical protein